MSYDSESGAGYIAVTGAPVEETEMAPDDATRLELREYGVVAT